MDQKFKISLCFLTILVGVYALCEIPGSCPANICLKESDNVSEKCEEFCISKGYAHGQCVYEVPGTSEDGQCVCCGKGTPTPKPTPPTPRPCIHENGTCNEENGDRCCSCLHCLDGQCQYLSEE